MAERGETVGKGEGGGGLKREAANTKQGGGDESKGGHS